MLLKSWHAAGQDADGIQTGTALQFLLQLRLAGLAGLLGFRVRGQVDRYAGPSPTGLIGRKVIDTLRRSQKVWLP